MQVIETVNAVREQVSRWRQANQVIAFVPTMGNLHAGHVSLIELAQQRADQVLVSIFVNPLQFSADEDFATYPRTLASDLVQCETAGVAAVFTPSEQLLYPQGNDSITFVVPPNPLNSILCSHSRPHFFTGVATIIAKLFHIIQPDLAIFGKKDYQQGIIVQRLVADLNLPIRIIMGETRREPDGLALSSRNHYLTAAERQQAPQLLASLQQLKQGLLQQQGELDQLIEAAKEQLLAEGFHVDYLEVRCQNTLTVPDTTSRQLVILAAAWLGRTRLIDNVEVQLPL